MPVMRYALCVARHAFFANLYVRIFGTRYAYIMLFSPQPGNAVTWFNIPEIGPLLQINDREQFTG